MKKQVILPITVPDKEFIKACKQLALKRDTNVSAIVREILSKELEKENINVTISKKA